MWSLGGFTEKICLFFYLFWTSLPFSVFLIFPGRLRVFRGFFTPTSRGWNFVQDGFRFTIGKRKREWNDNQNQVSAFNQNISNISALFGKNIPAKCRHLAMSNLPCFVTMSALIIWIGCSDVAKFFSSNGGHDWLNNRGDLRVGVILILPEQGTSAKNLCGS